nr:hypothetical protein [Eubacterium sp.]
MKGAIMKDGIYAVYLGKEYTAEKNKEGKVILRSTDYEDLQCGFEPCEPFKYKGEEREIVCLKFVDYDEVEEYYKITIYAIYQGLKFEVFEEKDDMISIIGFLGNYREFLKLGMQCIDKGVYQKWIRKDEAEIKIVKEEL